MLLTNIAIPEVTVPLEYSTIISHQKKDKELQQLLKEKESYHINTFHGAGNTWDLICQGKEHRIIVPNTLKRKVLEWYHITLVHPGRDRTEKTISQHFY